MADGTMVVHFSEAEIFERKIAQVAQRIGDRRFSLTDILEKVLELLKIHNVHRRWAGGIP